MVEAGTCRLITLLGEPGIGKTRLAREFARSLDEQARVIVGRCLSYGEGITYWPLAEIVREAAAVEKEDAAAAARAKIEALLADGDDAAPAADLLVQALGLELGGGATGEIGWAARRLFEALARDRPLVLGIEDLHWGEEALLELLEQLPVVAEPLDRLESRQRSLLENGAVEGQLFHLGALPALAAEAVERTAELLADLALRELIQPAPSAFADDLAYRVRHILIRDAAYRALPKKVRAALHERYARWLEQQAGPRAIEFEEILGYHFEQAYRYRVELGLLDAEARALADRAGRMLAAAGGRSSALTWPPPRVSSRGLPSFFPPTTPSGSSVCWGSALRSANAVRSLGPPPRIRRRSSARLLSACAAWRRAAV